MNTNEFLAYFQNVKKHSSNQYTALCPAHGDKHNSLSIGYRCDKSHWLIYCHAGCDCKDILNAVGLKMSDLYDNTSNSKHIESQKTYIYKDENAEPVYFKTRIDYGIKNKTFLFEQPNGKKSLKDVHRVPYNLPNVLNSSLIYFVEGEKCADILIKNGLTATTLDSGANSVWYDYYNDYFDKKEVIIIPDNDNAGNKYAVKILEHIPTANVIVLSDLDEKEDVYDWLKSGHNVNELGGLPKMNKTEFISKSSSKKTDVTKLNENIKENQTDTILSLFYENNAKLLIDSTGNYYASIAVNSHREVKRLDSEDFKYWLIYLFRNKKGYTPKKESVSQAISALSANALYEIKERTPLSVRIAKTDETFWYDLSNSDYQAVKITADGWSIEDNPPELFVRLRHQIPQVLPKSNGDIYKIFDYININENKTLFLCWMISCFIPDIPHPMPIFHGEKGAAKSTSCALLKKIIDPSSLGVLTLQKAERTMAVNLQNHWFLPFDNVSCINEETSDTLCRAITGSGIQQRKLHTNGDDYIFTFKRCIALNGINNVARRSDLLDRAILIELSRIDENKRKENSAITKEFDKDLPLILGNIFDILSKAIKIYPNVKLNKLPRMADFSHWGYAIAQALGDLGETFLDEYKCNYNKQNIEAINSDIVATLLIAFMKEKEIWNGKVSELLKELTYLADREKIKTKTNDFPSQANLLSRKLNSLKSNLKSIGIDFKSESKSDATYITITNENSPQLPPYVKHNKTNDGNTDVEF